LAIEHEIVLELWREISDGWCFASSKIADAFKRTPLSEEQKREAVETLHTMIAQFRRLDFALQDSGATENGRQREIALLAAALLEAEALHARAARFSPTALHLENPARAFSTGAFREGLFEAQDEGSQLIAEIATPARGSRVLDACAGTGGKTLALSALMGGTG